MTHHRILKIKVRRKGDKLNVTSVGRTAKGMQYNIASLAIDAKGKTKGQLKNEQKKAVEELTAKLPLPV